MKATATPSSARLEARISEELHALLKRAAEIENRTMTDFVVSAVREAAQRAVEQAGMVRLSRSDQERFVTAERPNMPPIACGSGGRARRCWAL